MDRDFDLGDSEPGRHQSYSYPYILRNQRSRELRQDRLTIPTSLCLCEKASSDQYNCP